MWEVVGIKVYVLFGFRCVYSFLLGMFIVESMGLVVLSKFIDLIELEIRFFFKKYVFYVYIFKIKKKFKFFFEEVIYIL